MYISAVQHFVLIDLKIKKLREGKQLSSTALRAVQLEDDIIINKSSKMPLETPRQIMEIQLKRVTKSLILIFLGELCIVRSNKN